MRRRPWAPGVEIGRHGRCVAALEMSEFEVLQMTVAALTARLCAIERGQQLLQSASVPLQDAQKIALRAGIDPKALYDKERKDERRRLAQWLQGDGWGAARIARVMFCSERTVERWLAPGKAESRKQKAGGADGRMRTAFKGSLKAEG